MWGIFGIIFICIFHLSTGFSSFTLIDKYLKGAQLRVVQVKDWFECIKQCQEEPLCVSYNFDNKSACHINGHGVEERCQLVDELTSRAGWIYHQIRAVTKKIARGKKQGSCPCNCGASKQCRVEPGYGDVREKAATNCKDILLRRGSVPNRAYYLQGVSGKPVYCHMEKIPGCGNEGGWTLVMKINGSKTTFGYTSDYWTTPDNEYQPGNGENLDEKETKLKTFSTIYFEKICFGMKTFNSASSIHWLMKKRSSSGDSLYSKLNVNVNAANHETFGFNRTTWLSLLPGSKLGDGKKKDGFNVKPLGGDGARVRIGTIVYPGPSQDENGVPISYIGFGAGGDAAAMHVGLSCGNVNGANYIPAFGYILVN